MAASEGSYALTDGVESMLPGGGFSKRTAARRQRNIRIVLGLLAGVGAGFLPFYLYNLKTPGTHPTAASAGFGVPSEWRHARVLAGLDPATSGLWAALVSPALPALLLLTQRPPDRHACPQAT